jgi:Holliday junction DNA helicase RuvA
MIEKLRGEIESFNDTFIIMQVHDIFYKIYVSKRDYVQYNENWQPKEENGKLVIRPHHIENKHTVYIDLIHTDSLLCMYGFFDETNRQLFRALKKIPGIGNKAAMLVVDKYSYGDMTKIVETDDIDALVEIKGVGKKVARTILDKIKL